MLPAASDRAWTADDVPSQEGRRYVVTGANTGLGLEVARILCARGASVVLACRNVAKGESAAASLRPAEGATVEVRALDLASLASIGVFADTERTRDAPLHGLVCNAGVMALPAAKTVDGFEMQLGTNHLGHFALTARLLPLLLVTPGSRVVVVSSGMHRGGTLSRFDDPFFVESPYSRWAAYCQSKLANLLFMLELDRRLRATHALTIATGAHPGYAATELQGRASALGASAIEGWLLWLMNVTFAQSAAAGAWPLLRAATDPEADSGDYFGPRGPFEGRGRAVRCIPSRAARNEQAAARLWAWSEKVTGVRYADHGLG